MAIKHRIRPFGLFFDIALAFPTLIAISSSSLVNFSSHSVSIFVHVKSQVWVEKWRKSWMPLSLSFLKIHRAPLRLDQTNFCLFGKMQCLFSGFAFIRLSLRMETSAKSLFIIEIWFFKNNFSQLSEWLKKILLLKKVQYWTCAYFQYKSLTFVFPSKHDKQN